MAVMGRPSIYSEELLAKAIEYCNSFNEIDPEDMEVLPSIAGLALELNICRDTVYDWIKQPDKAEFSYIAKQLLATQEVSLVNNGLTGRFNPSVTKMMLGKHGYSDKMDTTVANPDGSNLDVPSDIEIARKLAFALNNALLLKAKESESSDNSTKQT